jgi:hypothetical protein
LKKNKNRGGFEMKIRDFIVPVCVIVAIVGSFFVPKDAVVMWVLFWSALGAGLVKWIFPAPKQHRDYRPDLGQLLMYRDSEAITIKRNGLVLRLVITWNGYENKQIWISEPRQGLDNSFRTDGETMTEATFSDGQTLSVKRNKKGFWILWPKTESPWRLSEE